VEIISAGIFGPKLSGKTTLAKALSNQFWVKQRKRSLVLDPNLEQWGNHSWVTDNEESFWRVVWGSQYMVVIVEESAETINRDKGLINVFTRLRHNHHKLLVIGHSGVNLLPIMREQLDTIFLFRQSEKAAAYWAETFAEKGLLQAAELNQFEFLRCHMFTKPQRLKLQL